MKLKAKFSIVVGSNILCWIGALIFQSIVLKNAPMPVVTISGASILLLWAIGAMMVFRGICHAANATLVAAQDFRSGNLHAFVDAGRSDEMGQIHQVLKEINDRIFTIVGDVRSGTTHFAITSGLLSVDNKALSVRTQAQSALLEETAASTEQLTSAVRENENKAVEAHRLIKSASETALQGGEVIGEVVKTMSAIRSSSREISDIISVIDGISFQTNILALNAAVEAARAGESGRGFAVVAAEVRVLAQRVAAASKEIQHLILDSAEKAEAGDKLAGLAGVTMKKIVDSVHDVTIIMQEISGSSRHQSAGTEAMSQAIITLDCMTQQNAKLVGEIANTVQNLHLQSVKLTDIVGHFDLGAHEFGSKEDSAKLVDDAVLYAEEFGTVKLIEEVNKLGEGKFSDRDLYLIVIELDGEIAAHGTNPRLLRVEAGKLRDPDGKAFAQDMIGVAKKHGSGWVDFKYAHPVTQEMKSKSAYVRRIDKLLVACGFYRQ